LPFGEYSILLNGHIFINNELGMAKAVADTVVENQAGFAYDTSIVTGFSHMHDSGTGGVSRFPSAV
jgi:putative alpha-1,2-mannosidase